jgi:hypothetical protein
MMGAHWDALNDAIEVATNPNPGKSPVAYVHPSKYVDYKLVADVPSGGKQPETRTLHFVKRSITNSLSSMLQRCVCRC